MSVDEEMADGWVEVSLGDLVSDLQTGFACGTHNRGGTGVSHLRPMNVNEHGRIDLSDLKFVPKEEVNRDERRLRKGDVLFNNTNSPELVGKTAFYELDETRAFSNHMTRIRFREGVSPRFIAMWLHQKWREQYFERTCNNHVSQASVSRTALSALRVSLPPTAEQLRIVAAVERILGSVFTARERLERVPKTLKRFRQMVLAAACSGRLTSETFDNGVPQDWRLAHLGELLNRIEAGKSFRCSPTPATDSEWGIIKVSAMTWGEFDAAENKAVLPGTTIEPRNEIRPGDLLLSRSNTAELAGATVLVRQTRPHLLLSDKSLRLVPNQGVSSEWLWRALQAPSSREQMSEMATGTSNSMRNISQEKLATIELQVPPFYEQEAIARRVSALFDLADSIEKRATLALQRVKSLPQAILAKAFRGELVPTEAELARREGRSYQTASELFVLTRLDESANGEPKTKRARAKKSSKRSSASGDGLLEFMDG